jgi:hypothetical protein
MEIFDFFFPRAAFDFWAASARGEEAFGGVGEAVVVAAGVVSVGWAGGSAAVTESMARTATDARINGFMRERLRMLQCYGFVRYFLPVSTLRPGSCNLASLNVT